MRTKSASDRLFYLVFGALTLLAAVPFWLTRILPMQDYPQFLVFARVFGDCRDPATPFHGTYAVRFALSPLLLPILVTRALAWISDFETAGRLLWTAYAVGLPLASLYLLRVLGRDRWAVLLVFPILMSFWVAGGFFAFATAAPILVLGLASAVRWLEAPSWKRGSVFAALLVVLHFWHALAFAQILGDFGLLWLLTRFDGPRARLRALLPTVPALGFFAVWILATVQGHAPGSVPPTWPPFFTNASRFFTYVGSPLVPDGSLLAVLLAIVLVANALAGARGPAADGEKAAGDKKDEDGKKDEKGEKDEDGGRAEGSFRVANPFALLALTAVVAYAALPNTWLGVEGVDNRQPWTAALLFVFGWALPTRPAARVALFTTVAGVGAVLLVHTAVAFAAFDRETEGASRLLDRLGPGDTLLAPVGVGASKAFPGKPLVGLELYATLRHGGLPNRSFAGYAINIIQYVDDENPMPGIVSPRHWIESPRLHEFDYVLVRAGNMGLPFVVQQVARDGEWSLYQVCGSRKLPICR